MSVVHRPLASPHVAAKYQRLGSIVSMSPLAMPTLISPVGDAPAPPLVAGVTAGDVPAGAVPPAVVAGAAVVAPPPPAAAVVPACAPPLLELPHAASRKATANTPTPGRASGRA